jgi:hypothetical protein
MKFYAYKSPSPDKIRIKLRQSLAFGDFAYLLQQARIFLLADLF